jgi:hypothetical protein
MSGVEKNNDNLKSDYFSSNRHDATAEILKTRGKVGDPGQWNQHHSQLPEKEAGVP